MRCGAGELWDPCCATATCACRCDEAPGEASLSASLMACVGTRLDSPVEQWSHLARVYVL